MVYFQVWKSFYVSKKVKKKIIILRGVEIFKFSGKIKKKYGKRKKNDKKLFLESGDFLLESVGYEVPKTKNKTKISCIEQKIQNFEGSLFPPRPAAPGYFFKSKKFENHTIQRREGIKDQINLF